MYTQYTVHVGGADVHVHSDSGDHSDVKQGGQHLEHKIVSIYMFHCEHACVNTANLVKAQSDLSATTEEGRGP